MHRIHITNTAIISSFGVLAVLKAWEIFQYPGAVLNHCVLCVLSPWQLCCLASALWRGGAVTVLPGNVQAYFPLRLAGMTLFPVSDRGRLLQWNCCCYSSICEVKISPSICLKLSTSFKIWAFEWLISTIFNENVKVKTWEYHIIWTKTHIKNLNFQSIYWRTLSQVFRFLTQIATENIKEL